MDAVDLLFRRLVLAARAAGALERPVTVGELLDQFAPYAAARRDGGFDTHDDYLHAMMRLVSGERSLLFGDDLMQDDLKAELQAAVPDLSVLRTYAHTKVRISSAGVAPVLAGDIDIDLRPPTPLSPARAATPASTPRVSGSPPRVTGSTARVPGNTADSIPAAHSPADPPHRDAGDEPFTAPLSTAGLSEAFAAYQGSHPDTAAAAGTDDGGCPYCAQALPEGRQVKFCPSCGQNLLVKRCPGCSAEIEHGWKFCVTCGRKA